MLQLNRNDNFINLKINCFLDQAMLYFEEFYVGPVHEGIIFDPEKFVKEIIT